MRPTETKTRIEVHDYVDTFVPVLARMHDERRTAYAALGFDLPKLKGRAPRFRRAPTMASTNGATSSDPP